MRLIPKTSTERHFFVFLTNVDVHITTACQVFFFFKSVYVRIFWVRTSFITCPVLYVFEDYFVT